jgi:2-keto-3-deoxy-6-phosphogluconate aldolase
MARHLYIGNNVAVARTVAGKLDNGAIEIQKLTQNGPAAMSNTDTIADSPQFRIVQGNGTRDIVSPWIYGRDVINYSGKAKVAAAACTVTDTIAGSSAAAGSLVLKFVRLDGTAPEFFSFTTAIAASVAHTAADLLVKAAYEAANLPDWLNIAADATAGATVVFSGAKRGDVAQSGNVWEYEPVQIQLIVESYDGGTQTHTASATTPGTPGVGDGFAVKAFEESLMGTQYGYYNRLAQPITPVTTAVTGTSYDMYNIVATKDGSSASQINGVDNLIEITIAFNDSTAGIVSALRGSLNSYLGSAGFATFNI